MLGFSGVFDAYYYLDENPELKRYKFFMLLHCISKGSYEGRHPCVN